MVHNNKILTVSYGTFSCTLEGFEDSFDTMKAIAEYFRDLAADDRYFGAEPPQPDADMLARIAQREITRQVEAHSTDTGTIVLRASAPAAAVMDNAVPAPATGQEPAPEPQAASAPQATPAPASETVSEQISEPAVAPATTPEPVTTDIPAAAPQAAEVAEADAAEPAAAPEPVEAVSETAPDIVEAARAADAVEDPARVDVADAATDDADTVTETEAQDTVEAEDTGAADAPVFADTTSEPRTVPAVDSIAAKLQRIRAVVSQNDSLAQMDDYTEDQHADGFVAEAAEDIAQPPQAEGEHPLPAAADDAEDQIDRVLGGIDAAHRTGTEHTPDPARDTVPEAVSSVESMPEEEPLAKVPTEEQTEKQTEDTVTASSPEAEDHHSGDQTPPEPAAVDAGAARGDGTDADTDTGVDVAAKEPVQARVVKVKRSEIAAAIASGTLEQIDAGATEGRDFFDAGDLTHDSTLSPEDEADLMRELASVESELGGDGHAAGKNGDTGFEDNIFGEVNASQDDDFDDDIEDDAHAALQQKVEEDAADLSRLMTEADEKLDDPETSSRHETYSQLRAAVAVAEAERSAGGSITGPSGDAAYRDDLAEVVRPRRPALDGARDSRPVIDARPAPLKLVAEQRVDTGAGIAQRGPVRPRRVMTSPGDEAGSPDATIADSAFAEFAARMGATELPDLLEAAAAYLSFVEGHDKFSRPQLMNKVRLIKQDDYNREDGLRSFGQLLRDGKIKKKGGGRFAAAGDIGFQPDEREAG